MYFKQHAETRFLIVFADGGGGVVVVVLVVASYLLVLEAEAGVDDAPSVGATGRDRALRVGPVADDVRVGVVADEVVVRPDVAVVRLPGDHAARHPDRPIVDDLREVCELRPDVVRRVGVDEGVRERVLVVPVVDDVVHHVLLGHVEPEVPDDGDVLAGAREAVRVAAVVVLVDARARVQLGEMLQLVVPVQLGHGVGRRVPGQLPDRQPLPLPVVLGEDGRLPGGRHRHQLGLPALAALAERLLRVAADVCAPGRAETGLAVVVGGTGTPHEQPHHHRHQPQPPAR
uniref:Uncharacterized protein n=1 Tax=Anopheles farauti TaxID=69004 RepID=A0A182QIX9_9DIPT